ncbi:MAG: ABC transporter permease subunit [Paracoccus sp. (in: a-proteobacteria)]|nr:ABC transporter permease subunit [Paracoccus sp. (in: a-proteobacteria)]
MNFDPTLAVSLLPELLAGLRTTLLLLAPTFFFGLILSIPIALASRSKMTWLAQGCSWYTAFMRGAPQLVLLYLVYNGLPRFDFIRQGPLWGFFREPMYCAILVFVLNHAAFLAEIWRGALNNVPKGLVEASNALGVRPSKTFWGIELPMAFRIGLPAYRNEVILFIKATAAVSAITVFDLLGVATQAIDRTYDPFTPLVVAGAMYWAFVQIVQIAFGALERRLSLAPR